MLQIVKEETFARHPDSRGERGVGRETRDNTQTVGHRRTRRDHATETAEDYVEAVADVLDEQETCRVVDLSRRFGVSHVTVTRIIARLQEEGLVRTEAYRPIELTQKGKRLARMSRERHESVFQFLLAIGVDEQTAAVDAEGIEHHVSPKTLEKFDAFVRKHRSNRTK